MKGLSPVEMKRLILSVGTHKGARPLTPVEVGQLLQKTLAAGTNLPELAEDLHLDGTTMIGRFTRLLGLAPEVQHLVDWGSSPGTLGFTASFEITRLQFGDQIAASTAILELRLSSAEVRQVVQLRLRSGKSILNCVAEIHGMRPHIEVRHVYIGAILDDQLQERLRSMTQTERDVLLRDRLRSGLPHLRVQTAKLGIERFTLVGGEELGAAVRGTLERDLNAALKAKAS